MDNEFTAFDKKECRKTFNRLGFAFCAFQLIFVGAAYLVAYVFYKRFSNILDIEIVSWLVNYLPMYLVAVPVTALILKKLPASRPEEHKLSAGKFTILILIGWSLTLAGAIFGNVLSLIINVITGLNTTNVLNDTLINTNLLIIFFFVVIMAPIVEEFLCRKLIVDHTLQYGEWTAIILSGLIFGLIHGNFFQFFYAFALGMLMAYIYIRTGRLRYTILFHMIVNTLGSFIPAIFLQNIDLTALETVIEQMSAAAPEQMTEVMGYIIKLLAYLGYVLAEYSMAIAGFVLLCVFIKKILSTIRPMNIPKGSRLSCMFLNPGMILFFIIAIADFTIYLIS